MDFPKKKAEKRKGKHSKTATPPLTPPLKREGNRREERTKGNGNGTCYPTPNPSPQKGGEGPRRASCLQEKAEGPSPPLEGEGLGVGSNVSFPRREERKGTATALATPPLTPPLKREGNRRGNFMHFLAEAMVPSGGSRQQNEAESGGRDGAFRRIGLREMPFLANFLPLRSSFCFFFRTFAARNVNARIHAYT